MEASDGSTKILGDNLQPPFMQHRSKNVSGDETLGGSFITGADSGYGSSYSTTPSGTPNVSLGITSTSTPQRTSNNSNLITIRESTENNDAVKLTPVTQNIRKICDFHITTPKEERGNVGVGNKRSSVAILDFENFQSTPKKPKLDDAFARKFPDMQSAQSTPKKIRCPNKNFRQKLKSAPDLQSYIRGYNNENEHSPHKANLSPIGDKSDIRDKRIPLSSTSYNFIQSSTPKSSGQIYEISKDNHGSAKKLLQFSDEQHLNQGKSIEEMKTELTENYLNEYKKLYTQINVTSSTRETNQRSNTKKFWEMKSTTKRQERSNENQLGLKPFVTKSNKNKTETESQGFQEILKINTYCHDMEISPLKPAPAPDCNKCTLNNEQSKFEANYDLNTSQDLQLNSTIECESIIPRSNTPTTLVYDNITSIPIPRTPPKLKPSTSVETEKLEIVYPALPHTPSKRQQHNNSVQKRKVNESNEKPRKNRRRFYDGITTLNIMSKLERYSLVLDKIFRMLSSQDLVMVSKVSKSWRRSLRSNPNALKRLKDYLEESKHCKENEGVTLRYSDTQAINKIITGEYKKSYDRTRMPFSQTNLRNDRKRSLEESKSPPVSPSKRKFYENQKVVKTLANNEKLIKCPRCGKSSRIRNPYEIDTNQNQHNNNINTMPSFGRNYFSQPQSSQPPLTSLDLISTKTTSNTIPSSLDNSMILTAPRKKFVKSFSFDSTFALLANPLQSTASQSKSLPQYGECSGKTCKYRFCLKCLCEYHSDTKCKIYEENSPTKDDIQNGVLQLPRNTKNNRRKSLKRLCFV